MNCPCCSFPECDHPQCRGRVYDPDEPCPCCGHPKCEAHGANKRLSQGIGRPDREWSPFEKAQLYARGFRDGAGVRPIDDASEGLVAYDRGFHDGRRARREAIAKYSEEIGYTPSILRTTSGVDSPGAVPREE